jgi:tetratricopeptide (TPR) repeat protein
MLAGDQRMAVRLARTLQPAPGTAQSLAVRGNPLAEATVVLALVADAAGRGNWRDYEAARVRFRDPVAGGKDPPIIATLLEAYGLSARGRHAEALALLDVGEASGRVTRSYFDEHRAHLLTLAGRWPEAAEALFRVVGNDGSSVGRLRVAAAAAALEASRTDPAWRDRAITLLGSGPANDPVVAAARARLVASPTLPGRRLGGLVSGQAEGVALLFLRLAVDLSRERNPAPPIAFARLATFAAPGLAETWLIAAETLARQDQPALALAALEQAPAGSALDRPLAWRRASLLSASGNHDAARAILRPLVTSADAELEDWVRMAEIDRAAGDHASAARHLGRAVALLGEEPGPQHAYLFFLRGAASEQAGDFAAAEPDLRRALELQPDNAVYLNYLGYSLLDRDLQLDEAEQLIARAFAAQPENGAIIDSMGWAAFIRGRYAEAVELLERARAAEPADPTIADHLGDALWKVGRRIEARHAWTAAQALDPTPKLAERLSAKLSYGLDRALAGR